MIKLIQDIPSANNGEQHTDNDNNNITKYLQLNKTRILDLSEKNYENLVEALANNGIDTAATSPTPTSLPLSSSMFPSSSNQRDICRIEDSKTYHNSKGDIVE
jgi:hypothetical protein